MEQRKKKIRQETSDVKTTEFHEIDEYVIAIIGGGISGVCCAQELTRLSTQSNYRIRILLISASDTLKETKSMMKITNHLEEISVFERKSDSFQLLYPNIEVVDDIVQYLDSSTKLIYLQSGESIKYDKVCVCSGASPQLLAKHPNIIGIRDLESVQDLANRLRIARKVAIVGNGGISLELVHELRFTNISWIIKDQYLGNTFFDATASAFILPSLLKQHLRHSEIPSQNSDNSPIATLNETSDNPESASEVCGVALGPEWVEKTKLREQIQSADVLNHVGKIDLEYGQEVVGILSCLESRTWKSISKTHENLYQIPGWEEPSNLTDRYPLYLHTNQNKVIGCDFVISAIGVLPCTSFLNPSDEFLKLHPDIKVKDTIQLESGAIIINECFESTCSDVYAAGDCCSVMLSDDTNLNSLESRNATYHRHWFQMRLWSQARSMGIGAAHSVFSSLETSILGKQDEGKSETLEEFKNRAENIWGGVMFNVFAHVTHFFDHKVVLLGRYNGQGLGSHVEKYIKEMVVTPDGLVKEKYRDSVAQGKIQPLQDHEKTKITGEEEKGKPLDLFYQQSIDELQKYHLEIWTRITPNEEYVKLIIHNGRVIGALLIGDTDLEEVCENLILNELDVSRYGMELLDPDIDIEDYFD